jgi:hypothetical protein
MSARVQGTSESALDLTHDYSSSNSIDTLANTPIESNGSHSRLKCSDKMTSLGLNNSDDDPLPKKLASLASPNGVAAEHESSTEVAGVRGEVEIGGLEEGQIWADLDFARGFGA